jgi:predicted Zn-dependent protease
VALIAPGAMRSLLLAADSLRLGRAAAALSLLDDLERQQADTSAAVFLASGSSLRGAALLELRRDDEAGTALARAVQLNPDDMNAHRLLAELHRRNGRPHLAAQELQRHLGLMPDDAAARRELETLLGEAR